MFCYPCFSWCIIFVLGGLTKSSLQCLLFFSTSHMIMTLILCCLHFYRVMNSLNMSQGVLDGKYDDLPEQSFYMVGGIDEVIAKAEKIAKESAS